MKLTRKNRLFLVLLWWGGLFSAGNLDAQKAIVEVSIDKPAILIGEQAKLNLTITSDPEKKLYPLFPADTLMHGVEVLAYSKPDSLVIDNRLQIKQDILITSFDSALYLLPPFRVIDGIDTVYSNQIALKVASVPVNVDKPEEFFDIKPVWKPPFVLADYYPLILEILLAILLIAAAIYFYKRYKNRKSLIPFRKEEPKLPPHEQAIKELDEIRQQKLWQQGRVKEYYTQITDILRRYMEERFFFQAMEMTSGEILDHIRQVSETDSVYENLKQILQLADLVKFAKWKPLPDENDLSIMNAYLFVNQTKVEELPVAAAELAEDTVTDEETLKK